MEREFYTAKVDRVFKTIICNENDKRFITKILEVILETKLSEITHMKCELPITNVTEKSKIVDLIVRTKENNIIHVELNSSLKKNTKFRNFCYFSNTIGIETERGEEYNEKQEFVHIDLTYGLTDKREKIYYYIQDEEYNKYTDNVKIIEVNMDRMGEICYTDEEYKYLAMLDMNSSELSEIGRGNKLIMEYKDKLENLNKDEEFQSYMDIEKAMSMEYNTDIREAKTEGIAEGKAEKFLEMIKSMSASDITIEKIAEVANISAEEVENILNKDGV